MKLLEPFAWQEPKVRVFIRDTSQTDGRGLTGVAYAATGLLVSIVGSEAASSVVQYQSASTATIQDIATIGTYAAPSANNCRFKEVDSTKFPGLYEIQFELALFAVVGRGKLQGMVRGVANMEPTPFEIQMTPAGLFGGVVAYGVINNPTANGGTIPDTPSGARALLRVGQRLRFLTGPAASEPRLLDAVNTTTGVYTVSPAHDNDPGSGDVPFVVESIEPAPTASGLLPGVAVPALTAALAEPTGPMAANATALERLAFMSTIARNKIIRNQTTGKLELYADDGTTKIAEWTVTAGATSVTRGENA